ncbi:MAG TPA: bifunctional diaminohydroxyphosphoribosylaminopyrimidine deaminase/5-amino-6-(5-phosphoribosylamino)uracil reductase RibD [Candidatus Eremiobacteraceae bacterium]|nr:bifunctional diaminohydroxyphosphoribosylaminopyrimidine deaminase/5-amino-6-(5-phosphoribosylamino)uracil reductase RibD [Candidatus Eremiobacteraceae bacterium]
MNDHDIRFLQRALNLARKGAGLASPNPMVGCVIVRDGEIAGEGFHQYEWRDHAEIVALKTAGEKTRGATMYVSLEPCNHTGRTGPCTEAIIQAGVARVVFATRDTNPKVKSGGMERLQAAGIGAELGPHDIELDALELNEAFFRWAATGKPFVTLKSALTLDGQLALPSQGKGKNREWISSEESRAEVQRMRHASDALMTGIGTIRADDPLLTDRSGLPRRRRLLRVILDTHLRISPKSRIVKTHDDDLLVFTAASLKSPRARKLQSSGVEVVSLPAKGAQMNLQSVMKELGRREILSVLLESGPTLNGAALAANIVNKLFLFYAPKLAGRQTVPFVRGLAKVPNVRALHYRERDFGGDFALEAWLQNH